ncbi:MAG: hypothetical protein ACOY3P_21655 [Planctomycetota bacterium]
MAAKKPLVITNGQIEQLQAGDTLDAAVSEVDVVSKINGNAGSLVICTPVYVKANGEVDKGQANASGTVQITGLVKDVSVAPAATGVVQTDGVLTATTLQWDAVTGGSGGLVPGTVYYLDAFNPGRLTSTAPTTAGQFVVRVGLALSPSDMDISIYSPIRL